MKKVVALIIVSALFLNCSKEESTQEEMNVKPKEVKSSSNFKTLSETSTVPYMDDAQKNLYTFSNVFLEKFNGSFTNSNTWVGVDKVKTTQWANGKEYTIKWVPTYAWGSESGVKANIAFGTSYKDKTTTLSGKNEIQCGAITSLGLKEFKYGYFEARMKMPVNKKHWGAFWLMPGKDNAANMGYDDTSNGGSDGAEIDIAEGNQQNTYSSGLHIDGYKPGVTKAAGGGQQTSNGTDQWRVYGVLWTATELKFYCDGVLKYNFNTKINGFTSPFNTVGHWTPDVLQCMKFNSDAAPDPAKTWVAGTWADTNDRGVVQVDWLKVYSVVKKP